MTQYSKENIYRAFDIQFNKLSVMDDLITAISLSNDVVYSGGCSDINLPVPNEILKLFKNEFWDWHIGIWVHRGGNVPMHKDIGLNDYEGTAKSGRANALFFPIWGDYDKTPVVIYDEEGQTVTEILINEPMLVNTDINHSFDNSQGTNVIWYCLNFSRPTTMDISYNKILSSLV